MKLEAGNIGPFETGSWRVFFGVVFDFGVSVRSFEIANWRVFSFSLPWFDMVFVFEFFFFKH